jgi:hypothetical protein
MNRQFLNLPLELHTSIVGHLNQASFLYLKSTSRYFYILRSPTNTKDVLRINDHFARKSTLTFLAMPVVVQIEIYGFLGHIYHRMLGGTCHYYRRFWALSEHILGNHDPTSYLTCFDAPQALAASKLKFTVSCPWGMAHQDISGSRDLRLRTCDLPCFSCLKMRQRCEFMFEEWQNFGQRQCGDCTKDSSASGTG